MNKQKVPVNFQANTIPPAIILVSPQLGENIGASARIMLNFGFTDLRLVAPRDGWPNRAALPMAAGADKLLEKARVFASTQEAIADLHCVLAATGRRRELDIATIDSVSLCGVLDNAQAQHSKVGILFGPEKAGLINDDVAACDYILSYHVNPDFASLNLAQAVSVFVALWTNWSLQEEKVKNKKQTSASMPADMFAEIRDIASKSDLDALLVHLEEALDENGFFYPVEKTATMKRNIRTPFIRASLSTQEVRTLRGVIRALAHGRGAQKKPHNKS